MAPKEEQTELLLENTAKDEVNLKEEEATATTVMHEVNDETWRILYDAYRQVKPKDDKDDHDTKLAQFISTKGMCGFIVPFEIKTTAEKGRALYAKADISKGTVVYDSRDARFDTEEQWVEFLDILGKSTQPHLVQDVHIWAYCDWLDDDETQYVGLDLDCGSLMNHAGSSVDHEGRKLKDGQKQQQEEPNLDEHESENWWHLVATKDIKAGDEFLCDYTKFHDYEDELDWFEKSWDIHNVGDSDTESSDSDSDSDSESEDES